MRTYDDTFSGQKIYPGKVRTTEGAHADVLDHSDYLRKRTNAIQTISMLKQYVLHRIEDCIHFTGKIDGWNGRDKVAFENTG